MQEKRAREESGEPFLPFVPDRARAPIATHLRSTMIATSVAALRARGHFDAYRAELDPALRDELPATVAGLWLPMSRGIAHYEACDRLHLPSAVLLDIGADAGSRVAKSALSMVARLAANSGVTPWTIFVQSHRIWDRMFKGSSVGIFKLGPKECRFEVIAWPLASIEYNRVSFRGILRSLLQPFCTQIYVNELTQLGTPLSVAYRVAWA